MGDPYINSLKRMIRIGWLTAVSLMIWPVGLIMAWAYAEERKYWLKVFCASLFIGVIVQVILWKSGFYS